MTDKLVEAVEALFANGFVQAGLDGEPSQWKQEFEARTDALRAALESLTLPQTDLEQRAREMLGEEYAEANLAPVLTTNGPTGKRDKAAIRAITKALSSSVPEQDSWRDVETAPKDGTPVLITNPVRGGVWVAKFSERYQSGMRPENPWFSLMLNTWWHEHQYASMIPTHWMPLPPPPAVSGLQDSQQGSGSGASASRQPALVASLPEPLSGVSAHPGDGQAQGAPYGEWCRSPELCAGKGYCPRDPTCGD